MLTSRPSKLSYGHDKTRDKRNILASFKKKGERLFEFFAITFTNYPS